ncbi:MAG: phosphate acyltransferase PlsX [Proteobacteria bacterium]|nr:phosphate acyltransferase PlsX [Pseudomonadota bacterium]
MSDKVIISVDGMGGSNAPRAVVEGMAIAAANCADMHFLICGHQNVLPAVLSEFPELQGRYKFMHADGVVLDNESPVRALRYGQDSSMRAAIDAVKNEQAIACVSSGNTGALMVMSKMVLGMLEDISRPAIVGVMPNRAGGTVLLDMGANTECDEYNLFQFALMGASYAKICLKRANPRIGVLNVGVEEIKGTTLQKRTYELLQNSNLNFKGYVEGFDLIEGTVDVIVTDGFTGNIVLKTAEGTAKLCVEYMKVALKSTILSRIGGFLVRKAIKKQFDKIDTREVNGAMFAGINGIVVKSHGSAESKAFASALKLAYELAKRRVNQDIAAELASLRVDSPASLHPTLMGKIKKTLGMN